MEITVSTAISGTAILTAIFAVIRVSHYLGRFEEFKTQIERREQESLRDEETFVRRAEWTAVARHLDQRFDSLEKQIQDIRKEVLHFRTA